MAVEQPSYAQLTREVVQASPKPLPVDDIIERVNALHLITTKNPKQTIRTAVGADAMIVNTGDGKGKSSAAFGVMLRGLANDWNVAVVQFIKGRMQTGEYRFFKDHPLIDWHVMGHGFTWETQDREKDIASARAGKAIAGRGCLPAVATQHLQARPLPPARST